jgi:putative DNA primase/helicase
MVAHPPYATTHIPQRRPDYQEIAKENALLWEANRHLQQKVAEQEQQVLQYEREITFLKRDYVHKVADVEWQQQVGRVKTDTASPSLKATARSLREILREKTPNADGYCEVAAWEVQRLEALSESAHLSNINYLSNVYIDGELKSKASLPLFEKRLVTIVEKGRRGKPSYRVFLKAHELLEQPTYWQTAFPRNHGGADRNQGRRKKCQCGGEIVERDITITKQLMEECSKCHTIYQAYEPRSVHDTYLPTTNLTGPETGIKNQLDFNSAKEQLAGNSNQVDGGDTFIEPHQLDWKSNAPRTGCALLMAPPTIEAHQAPTTEKIVPVEHHPRESLLEESAYTGGSTPGAVVYGSIPVALRQRPQWVCWRYGAMNLRTGKRSKEPYNARLGANNALADTTRAETWATYGQAVGLYEASQSWKRPYDGIGYVFSKDDPFTGIDFDDCWDPATSTFTNDLAHERILVLDSYGEVSPSGTGVKMIVRGTISRSVKRPEIEMYNHSRFFTITGHHLQGTPRTIEDRTMHLLALHTEVVPKASTPRVPHNVYAPCLLTDEQVLQKARNGKNRARFTCLFDSGDIAGYASQSEADFALCNELAYWTDGDLAMMDKLFRQSKLYREKWERSVGEGETYGERTIRRAAGRKVQP